MNIEELQAKFKENICPICDNKLVYIVTVTYGCYHCKIVKNLLFTPEMNLVYRFTFVNNILNCSNFLNYKMHGIFLINDVKEWQLVISKSNVYSTDIFYIASMHDSHIIPKDVNPFEYWKSAMILD